MLFSPSACFGGTAAPVAWDFAHTPAAELRVLCRGGVHLLKESQEPVAAAYSDPSEYEGQVERVAKGPVARGQRVTMHANEKFSGSARGIAGDPNNQVQAAMGPSGANPRPPLTGPLLPCALEQRAGTRWPRLSG
jgi:hypothetical protein